MIEDRCWCCFLFLFRTSSCHSINLSITRNPMSGRKLWCTQKRHTTRKKCNRLRREKNASLKCWAQQYVRLILLRLIRVSTVSFASKCQPNYNQIEVVQCNFMFIFSLIFIINKLGIIQMTIFPAAYNRTTTTTTTYQPAQMKRSIIIAHVSHKQLVWGLWHDGIKEHTPRWKDKSATTTETKQKQK